MTSRNGCVCSVRYTWMTPRKCKSVVCESDPMRTNDKHLWWWGFRNGGSLPGGHRFGKGRPEKKRGSYWKECRKDLRLEHRWDERYGPQSVEERQKRRMKAVLRNLLSYRNQV